MDASHHAQFYEEIQGEIAQLDERREFLRGVAEYHREKSEEKAASHESNGHQAAAGPAAQHLGHLLQIKAAQIVLEEIGRAATAAEIADGMIRGGFPMKDDKKLRNAIFTGMTRKPAVFVKIGRGLWDLVSRPN